MATLHLMRSAGPIESLAANVRGAASSPAPAVFTTDILFDSWALTSIHDVPADELPRGVVGGTVELVDCTEEDGEFPWRLKKPERAKTLRQPTRRPQPVWFDPS